MNRPLRRLLVVLAAAAAALALWAVAVPLAGVDLAVDQAGTRQTVTPALVAATALLVGFAGWGLLAVLERTAKRGARAWTAVAAAVLAVSLLGPLGAQGAAAVLVLLGMHLAVGGTLLLGLRR